MKKSKKIKRIRASLLLTLSLLSFSKKAYAESDVNDFNIETVGSPVYKAQLVDELNSLPEGIQTYLKENNLKFILLDDYTDAEYYWVLKTGKSTGPIRSFIDASNLIIYSEADVYPDYYENFSSISKGYTVEEFNYKLVKNNLFYELGHAFDIMSDFQLSNSKEFDQIYREEVEKYVNTEQYKVDGLSVYFNISSKIDYFASSYACYISYPESLKENCPMTYEYINNYMLSLNEQYIKSEDKVLRKTHE